MLLGGAGLGGLGGPVQLAALFWFFLAIQPYLATPASRAKLGQWILAGTVPVIAVSLIQRVTGYSGLLETCWGLIRWPMLQPTTGAGLFDNPNVTGSWLAITLPFLVASCLQHRQYLLTRTWAITLTLVTIIALVISSSRNALATVPVTWALSSGRRGRWMVLLATLGYAGLIALKLQQTTTSNNPLVDLMVPDSLISKVMQSIYPETQVPEYAKRVVIFAASLTHSSSHPWFGIGENGFSQIYTADVVRAYGMHAIEKIQHSHNLWLEFAVSHGFPALMLLMVVIGRPLMQIIPMLWTRTQVHDRAWLLATLVMLWVHLWDIPSFDARVNILDWLLVAAIACIARSGAADAGARSETGNAAA